MNPDAAATLALVRTRYPRALSTADTVDRLLRLMHAKLGLAPRQIMLGDSICSDDLNAIEYPPRAFEMLGPFKLGGLDGFPFAGLTGMSAFAHHVPADGAVFLFHGPHIGIARDGSTGRLHRPGQALASACCGAARAAVDKVLAGHVVAGDVTELDYQQNTIEQILLPHRARLAGARCAVAEATEVMYDAIAARIDALVARTTYPCRHVVVMGGVLINAEVASGSFCCFRRLVHLDTATGARDDWLGALLT